MATKNTKPRRCRECGSKGKPLGGEYYQSSRGGFPVEQQYHLNHVAKTPTQSGYLICDECKDPQK